MQIHGLNKTTLLDFPGRVAATVFTGGCNFRCPFCHNGDLVLDPASQPIIPEQEIFQFLKKRKGILTGVCVTGGEPTLQPDLDQFLARIKEIGYLVKLDTNGYRPEILEDLAEKRLIDYIAMDIKSSRAGYAQACGLSDNRECTGERNMPVFDISGIEKSIDFIMNSGLEYEFRTTIVRELHSEREIRDIGQWIGGCKRYFLQSYEESEAVIHKGFHACSKEELEHYRDILSASIAEVELRG